MIVDFTPANDLEQTLVRAATDPAARPEFYRRLLAAELYILTEETGARGRADVEARRRRRGAHHLVVAQRSVRSAVLVARARRRDRAPAREIVRLRRADRQGGVRAARAGEARGVSEPRLRLRQAVRARRDRSPGGRREGGAGGGRQQNTPRPTRTKAKARSTASRGGRSGRPRRLSATSRLGVARACGVRAHGGEEEHERQRAEEQADGAERRRARRSARRRPARREAARRRGSAAGAARCRSGRRPPAPTAPGTAPPTGDRAAASGPRPAGSPARCRPTGSATRTA